MKADRLRMCDESRNWATRKVTYEHGLLKAGTIAIATDAVGSVGGWSYSYSPITEMLLQQLGIPRQDQPLAEMAKMFERAGATQPQGLSAADMDLMEKRWEERMDQKLSLAREADQRRIAELEDQVARQGVASVHACDHCDREFDTPQGRVMHMRQCPQKPAGD